MAFSPKDSDWLVETVRYLELDGYPKVATMLQLEIDKIDRILPKPESKHLFRGKEISQSSLHLPNKKKVIA